MENLNNKIIDLETEIDKLKDLLLDATTELNYSKQNELIEFIRTLYISIKEELNNKESVLNKNDVLNNLKKSLEIFAKDNYLKL